jgi:hypothetical protein
MSDCLIHCCPVLTGYLGGVTYWSVTDAAPSTPFATDYGTVTTSSLPSLKARPSHTCASARPINVDGGWSAWSTCSQLCGGTGISTRQCNRPSPANGGAQCLGN